jgi:hypothetical protein
MKTPDGKHIACDGKGCLEQAYVPVGLRTALSVRRLEKQAGVEGWLFVDNADGSLHFCPRCSMPYLRSLDEIRAQR